MGYNKVINGVLHFIDDSVNVEVLTDNKTLKASDSHIEFQIGTDAKVISLPAISDVGYGIEYCFTNIGADGNNNITISPDSADAIHGTVTLASSVVELSGLADKDLINTKATATTGNTVKVKSSSIGWIASNFTGIWASEA